MTRSVPSLSAELVRTASVVIPAWNAGELMAEVVRAVRAQEVPGVAIEVIVVDDGSSDDTVALARAAGARVLEPLPGAGGNPAAARNRGARESKGDPIVFLDADCVVQPGWLAALLAAHDAGYAVVGGSLDLPPGLSPTARCDYYCGWYLVHSRRPAGEVPHHPPPNLSVRREAFLSTSGYSDQPPLNYTNEERRWLAEVRESGGRIWFEPRAVALHYNRPGLIQLFKRNYRWAYTAVETKSQSRAARLAWLYRYPVLTIAASGPLALAHTAFIVGCWLRAGKLEPVAMLPLIAGSRLAYAAGMSVGGIRWLRRRNRPDAAAESPWR